MVHTYKKTTIRRARCSALHLVFAIMDKAIFGFAGDASGAEDNL